MHLIEALAAGVQGAGNGTVDIYRRDTLTRVVQYSSFEGDGAVTPGASTALSSYGSLVTYVAEVVDVVVKDSSGNTMRSFTSGTNAKSIEVISPSFTGNDYVGGAAGANKPTTLQAILDLILTGFGSTNWKITGGIAIATGYSALAGIFYNVKSYGAVGNGVANDRPAVITALAAAVAAGGGTVYFPPGVYPMSAAVVVPATVAFVGAGKGQSTLRFATAAGYLDLDSGRLANLAVDSSINLTTCFLSGNGSISQCSIGHLTYTAPTTIDCVDGTLELDGTDLWVAGSTQSGVTGDGDFVATACSCNIMATTHTGKVFDIGSGGSISWVGGIVWYQNTTTGPTTVCEIGYGANTQYAKFVGVVFRAPVSGDPVTTLFDIDGSVPGLIDEGNVIAWGNPLVVTPYNIAGVTQLKNFRGKLGLRVNRMNELAPAGSFTLDSLNFDTHIINFTSAAAATVTFVTAPAGERLTVVWHNNTAGVSGTITFDVARVKMEAASNQFTVAANSFRVFEFRSMHFQGVASNTFYWVQVAEDTVDEPE